MSDEVKEKYYVVWAGKEPGIYTNWTQCKAQVEGFNGAKFKKFSSLSEATVANVMDVKVHKFDKSRRAFVSVLYPG